MTPQQELERQIDTCKRFYYALKTLKEHGLKMAFENKYCCQVLSRETGKTVVTLQSVDQLIGFSKCLESAMTQYAINKASTKTD
jgi:hypothetical protein